MMTLKDDFLDILSILVNIVLHVATFYVKTHFRRIQGG